LFFQLPWLPEFILHRRDWALLVRVLRDTSRPGVFSDSILEQYNESWANKGALTAMLNWYRAALLRPSKFALDSEASPVKVPVLPYVPQANQTLLGFAAVTFVFQSVLARMCQLHGGRALHNWGEFDLRRSI